MARKRTPAEPVQAAPQPAKELVQVRLVQSISGPRGSWAVGETYRTDKASAARLIAAGTAVPMPAAAPETRQSSQPRP